jgi:hypothetical protein
MSHQQRKETAKRWLSEYDAQITLSRPILVIAPNSMEKNIRLLQKPQPYMVEHFSSLIDKIIKSRNEYRVAWLLGIMKELHQGIEMRHILPGCWEDDVDLSEGLKNYLSTPYE